LTDNQIAIQQEICSRIAQGESLREICKSPEMPHQSEVYKWLAADTNENSEFLNQYKVARMWQSESYMERLLEVAKDQSISPENRKLEMDALKAAASKLESKKYVDTSPREIVVKVVREGEN